MAVSLPGRDYELVGRLLAEAVTDSQRHGQPVAVALQRAASEHGKAVAAEVRRRVGARPRSGKVRIAMTQILNDCGYEPRDEPDGLTMANCPFDALAKDYTDLVCGINLDLLGGLADGVGEAGLEARLEPAPGRCCVRLRPSGR